MQKIIIGLVGPIASGKGIISDYLKDRGFLFEKLSDRLRDECIKRGLMVNRKNLQDVGNELRESHGSHILAQLTLEKYFGSGLPICIDGVRNPGEMDFIKNSGGLIIAITAPEELRMKWYLERSKLRREDGATARDFIEANDRDLGKNESQNGQQVELCIKNSDYVIENIGTKEDLIEVVREVLLISRQYDIEGRFPKQKEIL